MSLMGLSLRQTSRGRWTWTWRQSPIRGHPRREALPSERNPRRHEKVEALPEVPQSHDVPPEMDPEGDAPPEASAPASEPSSSATAEQPRKKIRQGIWGECSTYLEGTVKPEEQDQNADLIGKMGGQAESDLLKMAKEAFIGEYSSIEEMSPLRHLTNPQKPAECGITQTSLRLPDHHLFSLQHM